MWHRFSQPLRDVILDALRRAGERGVSEAEPDDFAAVIVRADALPELHTDAPISAEPANALSSASKALFDRAYEAAAVADARLIDIEHLQIALGRRIPARPWLRVKRVAITAARAYRIRRGWSIMHPRLANDPYPIYRKLHEMGPVRRDPLAPVWVVTGYEEVSQVFRDARFSSQPRSNRTLSGTMEIGLLPQGRVRDDLCVIGGFMNNMMLFSDPPRHGRMRGGMGQTFSPRHLASLRPMVQQIADGLIDAVISTGRMDFIADFAFPLPLLTIADVMGIAKMDTAQLKRWSMAFASLLSISTSTRQDLGVRQAIIEMRAYFDRIVEEARTRPGDTSLLAQMLTTPDGETPMSQDEQFANWALALAAGHETTTASLGTALRALLQHPDSLRRLLDDPAGGLPAAVEELLRFESPLQWTGRRAKEDLTLGGQAIAKNDLVLVSMGAANRDPKQFPHPDRLDLCRQNASSHLAFSGGAHYCMGAALARMELGVALATLFRRVRDIEIEPGFRVRWRPGTTLRSIESLPIRFRANNTQTDA